ncbi:SpoIIIAH-like family protein [Ornithinibacillus sp. BX22]|uniref:SpoIIIAH-like family protein n=2 Tax=Ornithinibacillus TaxID=484508 RepID=A0A923L615_9BACI|nr:MULTISPECIES: SpoIIIAH-like family protein [Ornithinibacillus]MBC5637173.1 SpoIIIAH-like family protein [Ornithinibacillus hominis]MBS3679616.1 SpoIIIAH-like family protein [Ornithinibacillus massiliensis]
MLKKQTVWLLTMLSLMIVLSVYYMTSNPGDLAYMNTDDDADTEEATNESTPANGSNVNVVSEANDLFAALRLEVQEERSKKKDRLEDIVASSTASAEEKNQAYEEIDTIDKVYSKEMILEETILDSAEYQDVLVRTDGDVVHVHVQLVEELTPTEVVNIMQMVRDEFGEIPVNVIQQPATES